MKPLSSCLAVVLAWLALAGAVYAQSASPSGMQASDAHAGAAPWSGKAPSAKASPARAASGGRAASRPTTSDTAMNTSASTPAPTGPNTTTPDAEGTSDLTGSTGASVLLGASPAPPTPAPPGGAPSGGYGAEDAGPH